MLFIILSQRTAQRLDTGKIDVALENIQARIRGNILWPIPTAMAIYY